MKKLLLFTAAFLLSSLLITQAQKTVIVVSDGDAATSVKTMLEDAGYTVDLRVQYWRNLAIDTSTTRLAELNAADLVFVIRGAYSSGFYGDAGGIISQGWQSVTTPMLVANEIVARNIRFGILGGDNGVDGDTIVKVKLPAHPIFKNTAINASDSTLEIITGGSELFKVISIDTVGTGTLIAADKKNGWVAMAEWDSGVAPFAGAPVQQGKRFFFPGQINLNNWGSVAHLLLLDICEYLLTGDVTDKVAPNGISLSNNVIMEGIPKGTAVGQLSATDPQGDIASYALVAGVGDTANAGFTIDGDSLRTDSIFDYDLTKTLSVRIQVTDSASNTYEKVFAITVLEIPVSFINNKIENQLSIYPIPANDFIIIKDLGTFKASIFSITGKKVRDFQQYNERLDISDLNKGMYIISVISKDKQYISKFIKQ